MIVVADTTPLNYLILIQQIDLLPALFEKVLVPEAVIKELQDPAASAQVRLWSAHYPSWLEICQVQQPAIAAVSSLDPGEREAIQLALERGIGTVLIDEAAGRIVVDQLGLQPRGTLGILELAANKGLLNFRQAFSRLVQTKFRMSPAVKAAFLARNP